MTEIDKPNRAGRGFTMAELLIVVAIIAVLVAIAIPVFTKQLERSREATDLSNIRAAYAEVLADALTGSGPTWDEGESVFKATVDLKQRVDGWAMDAERMEIGGIAHGSAQWVGDPVAGGKCTVTCAANTCEATIQFDGSSGGGGGASPALITPSTSLTSEMEANATTISGIYKTVPPQVHDTNGVTTTATAGVVYYNNSNGCFYQTDGTHWYAWNGSTWFMF